MSFKTAGGVLSEVDLLLILISWQNLEVDPLYTLDLDKEISSEPTINFQRIFVSFQAGTSSSEQSEWV